MIISGMITRSYRISIFGRCVLSHSRKKIPSRLAESVDIDVETQGSGNLLDLISNISKETENIKKNQSNGIFERYRFILIFGKCISAAKRLGEICTNIEATLSDEVRENRLLYFTWDLGDNEGDFISSFDIMLIFQVNLNVINYL